MTALIEPSAEADLPYIGWIPTVSARLSFRHIGEATHPTPSKYSNVITSDRRIILAYQRRNLSDALFQPVIHYLCSISGSFWFVLSAESEAEPLDSDGLSGVVSIFKSKADWRGEAENVTRSTINRLNELRFSLEGGRDDSICSLFLKARGKLEKLADIQIRFHLNRSGVIRVSLPEFRDKDLEFASNDYAKRFNHDIPKWISDQCYFFLRDISHNHQHHVPTSDTILVLQNKDKEDLQWRKNIIYSLYYCIIKTRRVAGAAEQFQALGVHAYCRAFKKICDEQLKEKFIKIPRFDDDALIQSISAKANEIIDQREVAFNELMIRISKAATWRALALALVAIVVAAVAILVQPRINTDERLKYPELMRASDFVAEHLAAVTAIIAIVTLFVWVSTSSKWRGRTGIWRDILEVLGVRLGISIGVLCALFCIVLALVLYAFWPAVIDAWNALWAFWLLF